jgi:hypothetical protein
LLALPQWNAANLTAAPLVTFSFASLQFALGVLLSTYFSHLLVATYGTVVMRRDTSGRTWIWGAAVAVLVHILVGSLWLVLVNGIIPQDVLAATQGTILTPLAEQAGEVILVLGSLLVILSLGLASVQIALGLYYMVQERLPAPGASSAFSNPRVRFLVSMAPIVGVLLLAELLAFTGVGSFADLLGISSAIALPLLGGVFPVLLLIATRRKGDFTPRGVWRLLGSPFVLAPVYVIFVGVIFVYGIWIYEALWARAAMLAVGTIVLVVTAVILRRGVLAPRAVIEVKVDQEDGGRAFFTLTARGQALSCPVGFYYGRDVVSQEASSGEIPEFAILRSMVVQLPAGAASELKVWAHRLSQSGGSSGLAMQLQLRGTASNAAGELSEARPQRSFLLNGAAVEVCLTLPVSAPGG